MLYTFRCPEHGNFNRQATIANRNLTVRCALCNVVAPRSEVYHTAFKMEGQTMPRRDDTESVYEEYEKEVVKRGWGPGRATQEIRDNIFEDKSGQKRLNRPNMTKKAEK